MTVQVTTATKRAEPLNQIPAAITVITQDEIRRSGATNFPEVLRLVPGVDVNQLASGEYAVSIRGFNAQYANRLLVMIDGRTIYNNIFGGVVWDLFPMMPENIDRIEVIRGPGGSLWGANAVNGIINIITKNAKDTLGSLASVDGGTQTQKEFVNYDYGTMVTRDASLRVYGQTYHLGNSRDSSGGSMDDNQDGGQAGFRYNRAGIRQPVHRNGNISRSNLDLHIQQRLPVHRSKPSSTAIPMAIMRILWGAGSTPRAMDPYRRMKGSSASWTLEICLPPCPKRPMISIFRTSSHLPALRMWHGAWGTGYWTTTSMPFRQARSPLDIGCPTSPRVRAG